MVTNFFKKTDLGISEIADRTKKLTLVERRVLILLDGNRSLKDAQAILGFDANDIVARLLHLGLVSSANADMAIRRSSVESYDWKTGFYPKLTALKVVPGAEIDAAVGSELRSDGVNFTEVLAGKRYLNDVVSRLLGKDDNSLYSKIHLIMDTDSLHSSFKSIMLSLKGLINEEAEHDIINGYYQAIAMPKRNAMRELSISV